MNDYDLFIKYLFAKADKNRVPLSGTFELTPRCTLDCKMCYIHKKGDDVCAAKLEKDAEWWISLARDAKDSGSLMLLLTGGEPLIRDDFEYIYTECLKMGYLMSVNTNATLIDEKKAEFFSKNPPQRINVTLYGMSGGTYKNLCGRADAYEKVTAALDMLKRAGLNVRVNYTVTPLNCADMSAAQAYAREKGFGFQAVTYSFPKIRTLNGENNRNEMYFNAEKAAEYHYLYMKNELGEDGLRAGISGLLKDKNADVRIVSRCDTVPNGKINCRAGISSYWVTYDGRMTPCGMMNKPSVRADGFGSAWEAVKKETDGISLNGKCLNCPLIRICDYCAACAAAETGRFDSVPEYACRKAAAYYNLCKKLLNE